MIIYIQTIIIQLIFQMLHSGIKSPSENIFDKDQLKRSIQYNQDNFQQHFNERMQTRDDFYDKYNDILQQKWESLMEDKGLDIYQRGLINEGTTPSQLIVQPKQLSPLMDKLEQENYILRIEVNHLSQDLQRFIGMVELLLEENRYIRDKLGVQNGDLAKLVEVVGINEKEEFNDQKQKIEILSEENSLLLQHLEYLKKFKEDYILLEEKNDLELARAKEIYERCVHDKDLSLKREEQLSKQLHLIEPKYSQSLENVQKLEFCLKQLQIEHTKVENSLKTSDDKYYQLKQMHDDLETQSNMEIDQLTVELESQIEEKEDLMLKLNNLNNQFSNGKNEVSKFHQENQMIQNNLTSLGTDLHKQASLLQIEKRKNQEFQQMIQDQKMQIQTLKSQNASQETYRTALEKQLVNFQQDSEHQKQAIKRTGERNLENLRHEIGDKVGEKEFEIDNLQQQLAQNNQQLSMLQKDSELKQKDIKDKQQKIKDLSSLQSTMDKYQESLIQRDNIIANQEQKIQLMTNQQEQIDQLTQENENMHVKIEHFENENMDLNNTIMDQSDNKELLECKSKINELQTKLQKSQNESQQYYKDLQARKGMNNELQMIIEDMKVNQMLEKQQNRTPRTIQNMDQPQRDQRDMQRIEKKESEISRNKPWEK